MKYRLALVEYLNTMPFSVGLELTHLEDKLEIFRVPPAHCAKLFEEGKVDISLCPIGALNDLPSFEIRGSFCIGADGEVGTVVLLSKVPLEQITSVRFDDHSRTSNILLQILAKRLWKKDWDYYFDPGASLPETCLMIGDKVFENKKHYPFQYDLAGAWKQLTGLPMVFAVWITRPGVPDDLMQQLDDAVKRGLQFIESGNSGLEAWQLNYLLHQISYPLDAAKREAMQLYFQWAEALVPAPVTR